MKRGFLLFCNLIAGGMLASPAYSQSASIRGLVTDESEAIVPGSQVLLTGASKFSRMATAGADGQYSFTSVPPGDYTIQSSAPGLALREPVHVTLKPGAQTVNLKLFVAAEKQQLTVEENAGPSVSTEAAANASAIVLRGADLDALSDNPDDLAADLAALAGPAAGPNGGATFIDGFSGGQLPPKESIREIRINQNPFSPEYDKLGFGRIEIFTKPGTDKFHGSVGYNFANDFWNSRNAYAAQKAPFHLDEFSGTLSGPINKRTSFNLNIVRQMDDNGNVINGVTLDPETLLASPFTGSFLSYWRRTMITPRVDFQLNANNTLSVRYAFNREDVRNAGVGGFNLVPRGYHNDTPSQTVQLTETAVLGSSVVNEIRFQYFRPTVTSVANTLGSALQVLGAFSSGGNPIGNSSDTQNSYEFQNYTSIIHHEHTFRFGVRIRAMTESSLSPQNYNGTFTFSGGLAPELDSKNQRVLDSAGQPVLVNITSIESYRRTLLFQQMGYAPALIRQLGGGASQFSINSGNPEISGSQFDVGAFFGDDWKVRPNLTASLGLRYEAQTNIHDWRDFAPRIGVAWAPGASAKPRHGVVRGGFGIFYDRFSLANTLTAQRFNGVVQQQFIINNPDFFPGPTGAPPPLSALGPVQSSTIERISSTLRAPYLMQSAIGYERQLPYNTTVAVTYANSHGLHLLRSADLNAPLPGTYAPSTPPSGVYPFGRPGLVALMESSGLYNQNQLIVNVNTKVNRNVSLNGVYLYNRAKSNTDGLNTFPANPYSMSGEYGPAATDMHHRVALGGTIVTKWDIRFNPLLTANTGPPFDITTGNDLYGDTLFNERPGIATAPNRLGVVATKYGLLDPNPAPGETLLPRNSGRGPGQIMLNMRVGRTFTFGRPREGVISSGGGGAQGSRNAPNSPFSMGGGQGAVTTANGRYSLTISMQIRNVTNHNNPGPIIGNITSPLFGQANQPAGSGSGIFSESANNRRLELQTRFTF
jgi:hypothetical protein